MVSGVLEHLGGDRWRFTPDSDDGCAAGLVVAGIGVAFVLAGPMILGLACVTFLGAGVSNIPDQVITPNPIETVGFGFLYVLGLALMGFFTFVGLAIWNPSGRSGARTIFAVLALVCGAGTLAGSIACVSKVEAASLEGQVAGGWQGSGSYAPGPDQPTLEPVELGSGSFRWEVSSTCSGAAVIDVDGEQVTLQMEEPSTEPFRGEQATLTGLMAERYCTWEIKAARESW